MSLVVRLPPSLAPSAPSRIELATAPPDLGALVAELERRHPGLGRVLDSSAVNAAVNGEVVLSGRDRTALKDGDEVEFLVMFAGG